MSNEPLSWGHWPRHAPRRHIKLPDRFAELPLDQPLLPYGNGRSYGDVCLNQDGVIIDTRSMDRFIAFDPGSGQIECEAGVLLSEIIDLVLPHGWFLSVVPGTAFVTVGGAIANDVHGKNHHRVGSFGNHLLEFELLRSDGTILVCTPTENADWFHATIGGLGLTGLIRRARIQLRRVDGPWIAGDSRRFRNLDDYFSLAAASDESHEYTVAWLDCTARTRLGRGIFMRGNHAPSNKPPPRVRTLSFPVQPPISLVNAWSLRLFNQLYFHRPAAECADAQWPFRSFFFPLDSIRKWNRMYGPAGFFQYQCVLPPLEARDALIEMLKLISRSAMGSFLVVLKNFGTVPAAGMLSFARPGTTLALDFPNRGRDTLQLLDALDIITAGAGGAVYPAKDARMSAAAFQRYFPQWQEFSRFIDPKFSSSFWRRVTETSK